MSDAGPLIVPIRVDALCVAKEDVEQRGKHQFAARSIDFTRLPFAGTPERPARRSANLADDFRTKPFDVDASTIFRKGVHLHWALPDALTHGSTSFKITPAVVSALAAHNVPEATLQQLKDVNGVFKTRDLFDRAIAAALGDLAWRELGPLIARAAAAIAFPAVPNRWLVARLSPGASVKAWVIESDFLCVNARDPSSTVSIPSPFMNDCTSGAASEPFRFLGRAVPVEIWYEGYRDPDARFQSTEVFSPLTAVGYGAPQFAAYYPDCNSVFGFCDECAAGTLSYAVIGWYTDQNDDPIRALNPANDLAAMLAALEWQVSPSLTLAGVQATVYYGTVLNIDWDPARSGGYNNPRRFPAPAIAVGNTPAEALSAFLSTRKTPSTAKATERILNAVQIGATGQLTSPNGMTEVEKALHTRAFGAESGGTIWSIVETPSGNQPPAQRGHTAELPGAIGTALNKVNVLQQACDCLEDDIESLQWQAFADWYKYMTVKYADIDPTSNDAMDRFYRDVLEGDLSPIEWAIPDSLTYGCGLAGGLRTQRAALMSALSTLSDDLVELTARTGGPPLTLQPLAAPNYWKAAEPVVLLAGDAVTSSVRFGRDGDYSDDGLLAVRSASQVLSTLTFDAGTQRISISGTPLTSQTGVTVLHDPAKTAPLNSLLSETALLAALAAHPVSKDKSWPEFLRSIEGLSLPSPLAVNRWDGMPWHPLTLQWRAAYYPVNGIQSGDAAGEYAPGFLKAHGFVFDEDTVDVAHHGDVPGDFDAYTGGCFLSSRASDTLAHWATQVLEGLPDKQLEAVLAGITDVPVLAQSLGGFNHALLQRELQTQFEINDPLSDHGPSALDVDVRAFAGEQNTAAPLPNAIYNPIRAGYMDIQTLRIVDSFGQFFDVGDVSRPIVGSALTPQTATTRIYLPPRIMQPARLLFRWLSANDDVEMNAHPATTPICGWVLTNHLDHSLMIYDAEGKAFGALILSGDKRSLRWQGAPGIGRDNRYGQTIEDVFYPPQPNRINPHLRSLVAAIVTNGAPFLEQLMETIDRALGAIDLPDFRESQGRSLLMGRPLALVRASLNLDLQGRPAADQSWDSFSSYLASADRDNAGRDTKQFEQVKFPVVLGDLVNLRDGLIGYFRDDEVVSTPDGRSRYTTFYGSAAPYDDNTPATPSVVKPAAKPVELAAADAVFTVTMLMDPHADVHASVGVLPAKAIDIPADQYADALRSIEITFLTAPILRHRDLPPVIPLPEEPGFEWSWIELDAGLTIRSSPIGDAGADAAQSGHRFHISEGYLKLTRRE